MKAALVHRVVNGGVAALRVSVTSCAHHLKSFIGMA